jgi:hypothetical protein
MKMRQSTIERCVYPDCKESVTRMSNMIYLPPCYAADGTPRALACFTSLYKSTPSNVVIEDDLVSLDSDGQRNTVSRR